MDSHLIPGQPPACGNVTVSGRGFTPSFQVFPSEWFAEGRVLHREVGVFAGVTWREVSRPSHNMVPDLAVCRLMTLAPFFGTFLC